METRTATLTSDQWNVIANALGLLPYREVAHIFLSMDQQFTIQEDQARRERVGLPVELNDYVERDSENVPDAS